ncbi:hypothetical protein OGATHE_003003 [Ogataea polymorpha]|uniref:Uncharacterized protein n=1 Tax=Ogataea polymorpha TaxID=460523 RepID=A0A9P8T9E9_9ASCO|nr:hypothetical protein OGATHE_003003 [Ogataea polymorpha]
MALIVASELDVLSRPDLPSNSMSHSVAKSADARLPYSSTFFDFFSSIAASFAYVDSSFDVTLFRLSIVLEERLETPLSAKTIELRLLLTDARFRNGDRSPDLSVLDRWNDTGRFAEVATLKLRTERRLLGEPVSLEPGVTREITDDDRTSAWPWSWWSWRYRNSSE